MRRLLPLAALCLLGAGPEPPSDPSSWDKFYSREAYVFGTDPIPLLKEYVHTFRRGRALDLATGEGRNAVYLAEQGFEVTGVDFSRVALEKSRKLAAERGVVIATVQADLREFRIDRESYDLITNIYFPQRELFDQIKAGLRPGGTFVYEQWHPYGWKTRRPPTGKPREAAPEESEVWQYSDVGLEELARIFSGYQIVLYREAVVDQSGFGPRRGVMLTEVSSLIAKKPF
jgi:SAM-dependent methyltransferase